MSEIKYVIVKDKNGKLRHYKSDWKHHCSIVRDNGYSEKDMIEAGMFLDKELMILDCEDRKHIIKKEKRYIGNRLNFYQDLKLRNWLQGRELESQVYYQKGVIGLREGD